MPAPLTVNIGDKFGRLTIIKETDRRNKARRFLCKCDCGNEKDIALSKLNSGNTKSCGCLQSEARGKLTITHGMSKSRIYNIWNGFKARCSNPNDPIYKYYGGRGIKICDEWLGFECFYEWAINNGYEEHLSLERNDVNGDYDPSNCSWATRKEQANNKRNSRFITYKGETKTLKQWSEAYEIDYISLFKRLKRGWGMERALTSPMQQRNKKGNEND